MTDDSQYADPFRVAPNTTDALAGLSMPLADAMLTQRAVRRVHPEPVDDAVVLKCIELALHAPTGANGQNWEFIVVKDRSVIKKLAGRYRKGWKFSYGGLLSSAGDNDESLAKVIRAAQWQVDHFTEIRCALVSPAQDFAEAAFERGKRAWEQEFLDELHPDLSETSIQHRQRSPKSIGIFRQKIVQVLPRRFRHILGQPAARRYCPRANRLFWDFRAFQSEDAAFQLEEGQPAASEFEQDDDRSG